LIDSLEGRNGQFNIFLEWAKTKTLVFVGYSFDDLNLQTLYRSIVKDGENHPPHYLVDPSITPPEEDYWRERRVRTLPIKFDGFLAALALELPDTMRGLAVYAPEKKATQFNKFITSSGGSESSHLINYLNDACQIVSSDLTIGHGKAIDFYRGVDCGWRPVQEQWDVRRRLVDVLLNEQILPVSQDVSSRLVMVMSHAGAGRSQFMRRTALEAATVHDKVVLFVGSDGEISQEAFEEIFSLTSMPVFLFVDDVSEHLEQLSVLFSVAKSKKWKLVVIGSERLNEWNMSCEGLGEYVHKTYEIHRLNELEIKDLLKKLEAEDALGDLKGLTFEERFKRFCEVYDRQLLVALHEATHGKDFRDIIQDEFASIYPDQAKYLYLDICSLHRLGRPVRAGLISRVHDIPFEDFKEKFFLPLEQVVFQKFDPRSGDYVYQTRHPYIAQIVYEQVLPNESERFDNLLRVISKLNSSYSYDQTVMSSLLSAANLFDIISDHSRAKTLYEAALHTAGEQSFIYQQWAIYELRRAGDMPTLDRAEEYATRAHGLDPHNPTIKHTLAEISLKRSRLVDDPQEQRAWRHKAVAQAKDLIGQTKSSHPFHTIAKAEIDAVREALADVENNSDTDPIGLEEAIKRAESAIRDGKDRFPSDSHILDAEAELASQLRDSNRAMRSLEKAFEAKPQSEFVGKRLALIYEYNGMIPETLKVLKTTLDFNPGSQDLHYDYAQTLIKQWPGFDLDEGELLSFHLKRSFSPNDKRYDRQFWYARQLCLLDKYSDAHKIFQHLKAAGLPYAVKKKTRGSVLDKDGQLVRFSGVVSTKSDSFGFIKCDAPSMDAYFEIEIDNNGATQGLSVGGRVSFALAFNMFGPVAADLQYDLGI